MKAMDRDISTLFEKFDDAPRDLRSSGPASEVSIRPACMSDARAIGRISAEREGKDSEEVIAAVERALASDSIGQGDVVLVAEVDGFVVGFAKAQYREEESEGLPEGWYLTGIVVDPRFRRRGFGAKLTAARMRWIGDRGTAAYYFANAMNRVSIALHEEFGFVEVVRDSSFGGVSFVGGEGILFKAAVGGSERREDANE
jgi:ribosomal protein S18 acetylase RimI-like enzyme